jgi:hypothetical protein
VAAVLGFRIATNQLAAGPGTLSAPRHPPGCLSKDCWLRWTSNGEVARALNTFPACEYGMRLEIAVAVLIWAIVMMVLIFV